MATQSCADETKEHWGLERCLGGRIDKSNFFVQVSQDEGLIQSFSSSALLTFWGCMVFSGE